MKRISAILLCLIMLLSLAPVTALAGDGDTLQPGMYTSYDEEANTASDAIELGTVNGQPGYVISGGAAYFVCDKATDVGFSNGLGTEWSQAIGGYNVFKLVPCEYYRDYGELIVSGEVYRVQFTGQEPIPPTSPEGGDMYAGYSDGKLTGTLTYQDISTAVGDTEHWVWGYVVPESETPVAYFVCSEGWSCEQKVQPDNRVSLNVEKLSDDVYKITPGEAYGSCGDFRLTNSGGGGMGITVIFEGYDPNVITPAHPVTDAERTQALAEDDYGPVSFTLGGVTYYMGIVSLGGDQPSSLEGMAGDQNSSADYFTRVGFWTLDSSGYKSVDSSTQASILSALGDDIEISLYAESDSAMFPAELGTTASDGLAARAWRFSGIDNAGTWQVRAVWRMNNGDELTSCVRFSWEAKLSVVSDELTSVEAVNAWLSENFAEHGENVNYWVYLAPGEFTGYISIPNGMSYSIIGAGVDKTTLNGGLYVGPGGHGGIHGLTMVGAGSQHKSWPQLYFNGEKAPNYGIYGTQSTAAFYDIVFTGYDRAIYNADGFGSFGPGGNGPTRAVFKDNRAGISIDASNGVGGLSTPLTGTVFAHNERAIELLSFNSDVPPSYYPSNHCSFIDNDVDVYNDSGRNFFMYGNYYFHSEPNKNGSNNYLEYTSKNPGKDKKDDKNLVADPLMMNSDFTARVYDDTAIPNSGEPGEFSTPAGALRGRNIMVVDVGRDKDTPLLDFDFPEGAASSNGAAARDAEPSFDPTVEYERSGDEIVVTIKDIPAGLRPTVNVYCDGWDDARVSFGGALLASSFSDEAVSFTATEGGTYVITRVERPAAPVVRPEQPEETVVFDDVPEDSYFAGAVEWAVEAGITDGTGEGVFSPDEECTRAQVVTFLYRAANCPAGEGASGFDDVDADEYYAEAVQWAVSEGITDGVSGGEFAPDLAVTRAQFVVMLYRAAGEPAVRLTGLFGDVDPASYYAAAVAWAFAQGITDGTGEGVFSPDMVCTRAQIVTFLYRALAL